MYFNIFELSNTKDYQYLLDSMGTEVIINQSETPDKVLITNSSFNKDYDDKKISSLSPLKRGDLIEYDGKQFMVISEEAGKRYNKYKGIMRLLPYSITFNVSCLFFEVPAFIETQSFGITDGKITSVADGNIYVNVPFNSDTQRIKLGDRFIKKKQAFKVAGIDSYTNPGIAILTCSKDEFNLATDDVVNEIAGGLACPIDFTVTEPVSLYIGQTLQLTWITAQNEPVVFVSSDDSIATVDATGFVTGVSEGEVIITIQNASKSSISDSVTISVEEPLPSFTVSIAGISSTPTEIKNNQSKSYRADVYSGGTLVSDGSQPVTWQIFADDQVSITTIATITTQSGTQCTVKNNAANSGYVQLRATLQSDNTVMAWYRIQMKPLF